MIDSCLFHLTILKWWLGVMEGFAHVKELYVSDLEKDGYTVKIYCKYNVKIYHK